MCLVRVLIHDVSLQIYTYFKSGTMIAIVNFSLRNYSDDSFVCMIKSLNIGFNESIDEISTEKMTFYFASRNHYRQHL